MPRRLTNVVAGERLEPPGQVHEILNPADPAVVVATLKYTPPSGVLDAVAAAARAFPSWRDTPVVQRCRILFRVKQLLEERLEDLARLTVAENGKTISEARGDVRRGIEVVEFAAGSPHLMKGEFLEDVASRVDGYVYREPLGVVAGACPFNFPAMVPMWMFPVAIACGNTFVLKPSDKCPATATAVAETFLEGGLPPGVLNVVHGARETFEALITAPDVRAVSFVGSTAAAQNVFELATRHRKRVQALGGAKNYVIVMPDADPQRTVPAIISSSFGCAGQRCMASSVLVVVGSADRAIDDVVKAAASLKLGNGLDPATEMGPLISAQHKKRVEDYIQIGVDEGARLILDGRGATVEGSESGFFIGATVLDNVLPEMRVAREEIFGPVLSVMRAAGLGEAIDLANSSPYGNGASIFTSSGAAAREFRNRIQCGMLGVNAGVPAPMAFFAFGGRKASLFGDLRVQGADSIEFYTQKKSVIERWFGFGETGSTWAK